MEVIKIKTQGFCGGVRNALKILDDALNNPNVKKPIYMLGQIIHNKHITKTYQDKNIIILNDNNKTRLELLESINEGTIIFSAHGVSPLVYKKASEKGLNIIDTTCPYVSIVHKKIIEYLNLGYECLYIGTKGHPECEAILGIDDNIKLITSLNDVAKLDINNDKIYVTNQTTLSLINIKNIYDYLKNKYKNIIIDNNICVATTNRQLALINQEKVDLCIIVGDKLSSNTKKLYQVSNDIAKIKTILVEDINDLYSYNLENIKKVSVSSGASTPSYLVDEIINYLKNK